MFRKTISRLYMQLQWMVEVIWIRFCYRVSHCTCMRNPHIVLLNPNRRLNCKYYLLIFVGL